MLLNLEVASPSLFIEVLVIYEVTTTSGLRACYWALKSRDSEIRVCYWSDVVAPGSDSILSP